MRTRNLCLFCIYILRNNDFQITNEASFFAFLQPAATRLKFLFSSSSRLSKTSSSYRFNNLSFFVPQWTVFGTRNLFKSCYGSNSIRQATFRLTVMLFCAKFNIARVDGGLVGSTPIPTSAND